MTKRAVVLLILSVAVVVSVAGADSAAARNNAKHDPTPFLSSDVYRAGLYLGGPAHRAVGISPVPGMHDIVTVDASNSSGYALQCVGGVSACPTDGIVWAWGDNNNGQLGNGSVGGWSANPVQVLLTLPPGVGVVAIGEAKNEGFAIDANGQGYGWGANDSKSLCIGSAGRELLPVKIPLITHASTTPMSVQGGFDHVIWLMANGQVEACGDNSHGQLGIGAARSSGTPSLVHFPPGTPPIVAITAGNVTSGAVDSEGNAYMWGANPYGQLGVGSFASQIRLPTRVVGLPGPVGELYAGGDLTSNGHTVALLTNGSAYAWGKDSHGQLGDGGVTNRDVPVPVTVPSGVTFTYVMAGGADSQGLDTNGSVWRFGATRPTLSGVEAMSSTADNSVYLVP